MNKRFANKSPAYQRYPADYLSDMHVMAMTLEQEAIYNRLMDICWLEGTIPNDPEQLKPLVKGGSTVDILLVLRRFKPSEEDACQLIHPRLEKEREKQADWSEKSRAGGIKSGEIRRKQAENSKRYENQKKRTKGGSTVAQPSGSTVGQADSFNTMSSSSSSLSTNTSPPSGPPQVGDETAARNGAEVEANGAEVEAKKEEKPTGPRRSRKGGGVGNGSNLDAARARTLGLQRKKPHPMLANNPPKPPDPRRQPFKAEICRWYAAVNGRDPEHTPWGSPGDRALDAMLDATSIRIEDLQTCLEHRAKSVGAGEYSPSLMPGAWLRKLPSFLSLPLDRYGNPLQSKRKPLG